MSPFRIKRGQNPARIEPWNNCTCTFCYLFVIFVRFTDINPGNSGRSDWFVAGVIIGFTSDYFTNDMRNPVWRQPVFPPPAAIISSRLQLRLIPLAFRIGVASSNDHFYYVAGMVEWFMESGRLSGCLDSV